MEKLSTLFVLCSLALCASSFVLQNRVNEDSEALALQEWYDRLPDMPQKVTKLHFYLQDIVSGPNATNIPVAVANSTKKSPTLFGLIGAIDDPLTKGPGRDSMIVGRAEGLITSASLEETAYHMTLSFVFTGGRYNGSSLSVVGHNPFYHEYRELPVVGGSGDFRLARGSALLRTYSFEKTGDAVVEYNIVVLHYC